MVKSNMFYPPLEEFKKIAVNHNIIPVYKEILADCETPVSTFAKLALEKDYSYLLESVEGTERWGRYSFISWDPKLIFKSKNKKYEIIENKQVFKSNSENPLSELKKLMAAYKPAVIKGLPRFWGGAVGYIGYEMIHNFEDIARINQNLEQLPDAILLFTDTIIIFDHFTHKTKIVACVDLAQKNVNLNKQYSDACKKIDSIIRELRNKRNLDISNFLDFNRENKHVVEPKSNNTKTEYMDNVKKAKEYIRAGDIIQTVISQRFEKKISVHPFKIYRVLRTVNPSPYMYYLNLKDFQLIGSSPEILVRKEDDMAELRPIAGTKPRGKDEAEEKKYEKALLASPKEKAEHIMLVDLGRNDLGRVCDFNSIKIPELMVIERYSHVIHLVSFIIGKLKKGMDAFDLFEACFPAGTVSGAPKIRAMEIIAELEKTPRETYAGSVGYFSYSGNMDMAITIRTILFKDKTAYVQAGAGLVADSDPETEFYETQNKAKALFSAIDLAESSN
ncbi:MAG: anthranilate synthase component I [Elusimicrobiota bacterium]